MGIPPSDPIIKLFSGRIPSGPVDLTPQQLFSIRTILRSASLQGFKLG